MDLGIKGKVALVTGGSKGIGKAAALELAREGCNVVISARTKEDLLLAEKEIGATGVETLAVVADMELAGGAEKVVSSAFDKFGRVDILFNNAGYSHPTTPITTTDQEWYNLFNIHVMACVRTCRLIVPKMLEQKWGRIINMASICGIAPMSGLTNYNACKAAVINFTQSLALEYSKEGICAVALCPGLIHTDIWDIFAENVGNMVGKTGPQVLESAAQQASAIKRFAKPDEVGKVVAFWHQAVGPLRFPGAESRLAGGPHLRREERWQFRKMLFIEPLAV